MAENSALAELAALSDAAVSAAMAKMAPAQQGRLLDVLREIAKQDGQRRFHRMYPDETTTHAGATYYARRLYPRHLEVLAAGARYTERCAMFANRTGKTLGVGAYETACHLTGLYPDWWEGRRFGGPISAWAAGKTNETTRDIVQLALCGEVTGASAAKGFAGDGMIPGASLGKITWRQGVNGLADTIRVKHATGRWSTLGLKSYEQGRGSFEGTAKHWIWCDEEPPADVYGEVLIRTATTKGLVLITFTPLTGMSETVMYFMPQEII